MIPAGFLLTSDLWTRIEEDYPLPRRVSAEDELVWCAHGSIAVEVAGRHWPLTADGGLWVPGGEPRRIILHRNSIGGVTFVGPELAAPRVHRGVHRVRVPAASRELLVHMYHQPMTRETRLSGQRLSIAMIETDDGGALPIPVPADPRLAPLCQTVLRDPSVTLTLDQWAVRTTSSVSTLARAFRAETGMTFAHWCRVVRMQAADGMLRRGFSVQQTARRVGYHSPSAFVAAFRRSMGRTPGQLIGAEMPGGLEVLRAERNSA